MDNKTAQSNESPEVKRNPQGAGRKPKGYYETGVQDILNGSAPKAARLLESHLDQKRGARNLKPSLQRAAEYIIDHAIGKARQKIEHSGGILTYAQLSREAADLNKKPRDILADVEEIANKIPDKPEPLK